MTNEIIEPDLSADEARSLTDNIRAALQEVWPLFIRAYRGRAWLALGYASWEAYCDQEMAGVRPSIESREQRREIVGDLRQAGMSERAIATAVGAAKTTVHDDITSLVGDGPEFVQATTGATVRARPMPVVSDSWTDEERELRRRMEAGDAVPVSLRGRHTRLIGWAERSGKYERVDRRTQWGNPFEVPGDGDRETVIANYEEHYLPFKPSITVKLGDLRGKALGCWCAPEPCHADVLAKWAWRDDH